MTEPRFLLDANSLIYLFERDSPELADRVANSGEGEIVTSAIAFAEFAKGLDWSQPDVAAAAARLTDLIPVLPFDAAAARVYADLPFRRHSFDRLIAAQVLSLNITLITRNISDFADVPGLRFEDWTK